MQASQHQTQRQVLGEKSPFSHLSQRSNTPGVYPEAFYKSGKGLAKTDYREKDKYTFLTENGCIINCFSNLMVRFEVVPAYSTVTLFARFLG
jgi:hypothetical protein